MQKTLITNEDLYKEISNEDIYRELSGKLKDEILSRLSTRGLKQSQLAELLGKNRSWVTQELLRDPQNTIRRLWAYELHTLETLSDLLKWPLDSLMIQFKLNLPIPQDTNRHITSYVPLPFYTSISDFLLTQHNYGKNINEPINFITWDDPIRHQYEDLRCIRINSKPQGEYIEQKLIPFLKGGSHLLVERISGTVRHDEGCIILAMVQLNSRYEPCVYSNDFSDRTSGLERFDPDNSDVVSKVQVKGALRSEWGVVRRISLENPKIFEYQ